MQRSFLTGILIGSFLFLPFFTTAIVGTALLFFYDKYWPAVLLALISDSLFVHSGGGFFHLYFFYTILSVLVYLISGFLRYRLWRDPVY